MVEHLTYQPKMECSNLYLVRKLPKLTITVRVKFLIIDFQDKEINETSYENLTVIS